MALEAEVEIASLRGTRVEPVESFLDGYRHTTCGRTRSSRRCASRSAKRGGTRLLPEARRPPLPRDLDRDGGRRCRLRCRWRGAPCPHRDRRLLAGGAPAARSRRAAPRASPHTGAVPTLVQGRRFCRARSPRRRAGERRLSPCRRGGAHSRPPRRLRGAAASGGPHDGASVPARRRDDRRVAHVNGEARLVQAAPFETLADCCATGSASPAPRSAATPAIAAPAPCCSTARRSAPASCRRRRRYGADVHTVEGPGPDGVTERLRRAFLDAWRRAVRHLHARHADGRDRSSRPRAPPRRAPVEDALGGVLCRCTGYVKIVEAVMACAQRAPPLQGEGAGVGR